MTDTALSGFADGRWAARQEAVMMHAEALALSRAPSARHRRLLVAVLARWIDSLDRFEQSIHLHLSPLIYAGLWGDESPAYPLAAAAVVAGLGQVLLYDQDTGPHPAPWGVLPREEAREVGTFLLYSLPRMAVAALEAPPNTRVTMWEVLAACLVRVTRGRDGMPTPSPLEGAIVMTAELPATFAALSAQLAGAAPPIVQACRRLGHALAVAAEFGPTRERGRGTTSMPAPLPDHQARARASPSAVSQAAIYGEWAVGALVDAGLLEPGRGQIRAMIENLTAAEE